MLAKVLDRVTCCEFIIKCYCLFRTAQFSATTYLVIFDIAVIVKKNTKSVVSQKYCGRCKKE